MNDWDRVLAEEVASEWFAELEAFVAGERRNYSVFPSEENVFRALDCTSFDDASVLLLGQDPYHDDGQAHGLSFSVPDGVKHPPSLRNIFKERSSDLGIPPPKSGDLTAWAEQGVVMLNAVLTVRAHQPNSHKGKGWERFTDAIITKLSARGEPMVFLLWGGYARKKVPLIDTSRHTVIESAHPSPLSAHNGFFGSRPFSRVNAALRAMGRDEILWG